MGSEKKASGVAWWHAPLALILVAGLLVAVGFVIRWFVLAIFSLQHDVAAVVIAGLLALTTAVIAKVLEHWAVYAGERRERIAEKKREVYQELLEIVFDMLHETSAGPKDREVLPRFVHRMNKLVPKLLTWSSRELLVGFRRWRAAAAEAPTDVERFALAWHELIVQIRKELGLGASPGPADLLGVFITDIDKFVQAQQ